MSDRPHRKPSGPSRDSDDYPCMPDAAPDFDWRKAKLNINFDWNRETEAALITYWSNPYNTDGQVCQLLAQYDPQGRLPTVQNMNTRIQVMKTNNRLPKNPRKRHRRTWQEENTEVICDMYRQGYSLTHMSLAANAHSLTCYVRINAAIKEGRLVEQPTVMYSGYKGEGAQFDEQDMKKAEEESDGSEEQRPRKSRKVKIEDSDDDEEEEAEEEKEEDDDKNNSEDSDSDSSLSSLSSLGPEPPNPFSDEA